MLSRTCGISRDGIPRGIALWDPPLPVVAVVWLGRPRPWWGSARWVSAPRGPLGLVFPRAGTSELSRGAWEWRGLAWLLDSGSGGGAAPAVCGQCSDPGSSVGRPKPVWVGTGLLSGSPSSVPCLTVVCGSPHLHLAQSWVPQTLSRLLWIRLRPRGVCWVCAEGVFTLKLF